MATWLILSYDASDYTKSNPKEDITLYLLNLGIRQLESYTDSTIHFYVPFNDEAENILNDIERGLKCNFSKLKYSLSVIASNKKGLSLYVKIPKQPLKLDYDNLVISLKNRLFI